MIADTSETLCRILCPGNDRQVQLAFLGRLIGPVE